MTKEKFLQMIVADPPVQVEIADNEALEAQLKVSKSELQEKKQMVQSLLGELEKLSQRLAPGMTRYTFSDCAIGAKILEG